MSASNISPIQRMLNELSPGERREHKRSVEPTGNEGRFWRVDMDGRIDHASLRWINNRPLPSQDVREAPFVRMSDLEEPCLVASEEFSPVGDLYRVSGRLFLFAAPLVECIWSLDPDAIVARSCSVTGEGFRNEYYLVLVQRRLDAIDETKTDLLLHNKRILPNKEIYGKRVYFPRGMTLREDIASEVHCFADAYSSAVFFSSELLSCAKKEDLRWFYARHPTGLSDYPGFA